MQTFRLTEIFVNIEMTMRLLGTTEEEATRLTSLHAANRGGFKAGQVPNMLTTRLEPHLASGEIVDVRQLLLKNSLQVGAVISIEQAFYCKKQASPSGAQMIELHAVLNTNDDLRIEALVDPERLVSSSAHGHLSKRANLFMIGIVIDFDSEVIVIRPAFIGWRSAGLRQNFAHSPEGNEKHYIHPSEIDQFSGIDFGSYVSKASLELVAETFESHLKQTFLDILSETSVDNDWGGEKSDVYTTQVTMKGEHIRSAWLLKGRSVRRPMQIADLGKNGDQIDRLFSEPADLFVVQSNQKITSYVRNMLDIYAHDPRRPARYVCIDGQDTARILLAYGALI